MVLTLDLKQLTGQSLKSQYEQQYKICEFAVIKSMYSMSTKLPRFKEITKSTQRGAVTGTLSQSPDINYNKNY